MEDLKEIIKKVTAVVNNNHFKEELFYFRQRRGIPKDGFDNTEDYIEWIKANKTNQLAVKKDIKRIISRCPNIKSDPVAKQLLITGILFNKYSYPKNSIEKFSTTEISGLGFIEHTVFYPFWNNSTDKTIKEQTKMYKTIIKKLKNAVKINIPDLEITNSFLSTPPGNPGDRVYEAQQSIEDVVDLGIAALRESISRMDNFEVIKYEDKNKHIHAPVQQIGTFALNRGLYNVAEIYWISIASEIDKINEEKGLSLNKGIPLANAGIAQIAQGKTLEGLRNLFLALEDDEKILIKLQHPNTDPEKNLIETILYTQFEKRLLNLVLPFVKNYTIEDFEDLVKDLSPEKRLSLFIYLVEYLSTIDEKNKPRVDLLSRGITLRALGSLTSWIEDTLKKNPNVKGNKLSDLLCNCVKSLTFVKSETNVETLSQLHTKLQALNSSQSDENIKNAKATVYIRNFSSHNYQTEKHLFYSSSPEYFSRILNLLVFLSKNSKL